MLVVSIAFGAIVAKWAVYNGQIFLNKTKFLQIANVNGFIFWLLCLAVFSLLLLFARSFIDKTINKTILMAHANTSVSNFFKTVLLGLLVILAGYFLVSLGDQFFNISPRFWKVQLNILNVKRLSLWLIYLPFYMIPMIVSCYMQTSGYFTKKNPKLFTALVWASNSLPALLFVIYVYGSIIVGGLTPITNAAMSRANGTMPDALILMIPVSFITSFFYRKTKNFYVPALLNSMIFAWAAVGTDLITFLG